MMTMYLHINFPENLRTSDMVTKKNIPCLCRVAKEFEIVFQSPLQEGIGVVQGWSRELLEERAVAGGGGRYTHYALAIVTIEEISKGIYKIIDLALFYTSFGWCQILANGEYAPPGKYWDDDEEDTIGR